MAWEGKENPRTCHCPGSSYHWSNNLSPGATLGRNCLSVELVPCTIGYSYIIKSPGNQLRPVFTSGENSNAWERSFYTMPSGTSPQHSAPLNNFIGSRLKLWNWKVKQCAGSGAGRLTTIKKKPWSAGF